MKAKTYRYPKTPFQGDLIKGYVEIERDLLPYDINFMLSFSMYASEEAKRRFQTITEKPNGKKEIDDHIEDFQIYVDDVIFNPRRMRRRILDTFSSEGYHVDPYMCFRFAYSHIGGKSLKHYNKIYEPVTANILISVTREQQKVLTDVKDLNEFIGEMLVRFDTMFADIQNETNGQLMFVPRTLSKMDREKKIEILNGLANQFVTMEEAINE